MYSFTLDIGEICFIEMVKRGPWWIHRYSDNEDYGVGQLALIQVAKRCKTGPFYETYIVDILSPDNGLSHTLQFTLYSHMLPLPGYLIRDIRTPEVTSRFKRIGV